MDKRSKYFEPLVRMVASGESVVSAAEYIGCGKSTAYRIAKLDEFKNSVNETRTQLLIDAMAKLAGAASMAVDAMVGLLASDDHGVRLRSAVAILDRFSKLSESIDLRERIEKLEAQQGLRVAS